MVKPIFEQTDYQFLSILSQDVERIRAITQGLVGETCWQARLTYGDELTLHLGEKRPIPHPLLAGKFEGSWILGTRATEWQLKCNGELIVNSESPIEVVKDKIRVLENARVVDFDNPTDQFYPPSRLQFSNGCELLLNIFVPNDPELAYYELFTPDHMLLTVGGATPWAYKSADSPVS